MPVPSISALERRVDKVAEKAQAYIQSKREHAGQGFDTTLPKVHKWHEFAPRTWIRTGDDDGAKIVRFLPYKFQRQIIRRIHKSRKIQILKARQIGVSEVIVNYILNRALTEPGFTAVVVSKTQKDSTDLANRVSFMAHSIEGEELKWETDNGQKLSWKGRGTIHFLPPTARSGRGVPACSVLFLDEAAFIENVEALYTGAAPSLMKLGNAGKIIVVSTPDLEVDWFGQIWTDNLPSDWYDLAEQRKWNELQNLLDNINDGWARLAVHYSFHPQYGADPTWPERNRADLKYTRAQWNAEFELKFGSTDSVIYPTELVKKGVGSSLIEAGLVNRTYVIAIDPNGGADDYFVSLVIDISRKPYRVVNMYRANNKSVTYSKAQVCKQIDYFSPECVVIEKNSMGVVIAEDVQVLQRATRVETIYTSETNKNINTDRVLLLLEEDNLKYPDGVIPTELRSFRRTDKNRREAAAGKKDDCVMALSLFAAVINDIPDISGFLDNL